MALASSYSGVNTPIPMGFARSLLEMIEDIEYIVNDDGSVTNALESRKSKPALLMCLMQIGETLNKIETLSLPYQ